MANTENLRGLGDRLVDVWRRAAESGTPMPGEPTLVATLAASRPAIREELVRLEERGYIRRRKGADTVVNPRMLDVSARIDQKIDRSELIASTGAEASTAVPDARIDIVTPEEAAQYEVPVGARVLRYTKVWSADGVPVIRADDNVVLRPGVAEEDADATQPVFEIAKIAGAGPIEWEIVYPTALAVSRRDAELLGLVEGGPALSLESVGVARTGVTAYWASELHATNAFQHTVIRSVGK
nr:GntR family transcriptional regulator [Gordonia sp. PP30]